MRIQNISAWQGCSSAESRNVQILSYQKDAFMKLLDAKTEPVQEDIKELKEEQKILSKKPAGL